MRFFRIAVLVFLASVMSSPSLGVAQSAPGAKPEVKSLRFSPDMLDQSIDPCNDFYAYACGNWMKKNPIPPDRAAWGRFNELQQNAEVVLHEILDESSAVKSGRSAIEQKIGDFYASCVDGSAVEKLGARPLALEMRRIAAIKTKTGIVREVVRLHRLRVNALFDFDSGEDFKDASQVIAEVDQGGMSLPDRDYYFRKDEKSAEQRKQYVAHVKKMFELLGDSPAGADAESKAVMEIETSLAEGAFDAVTRREPEKIYHKMSVANLVKLSPNFNWNVYFASVGAPQFTSLNVSEPVFFKNLNAQLQKVSLTNWKTYLRWQYLHGNAALLSSKFVEENFNFFGKALTGAKELAPRWKRCTRATNADLGEAVGQKYVDRTFGKEGKARTLNMVNQLEKALAQDISTLPWMTDATKKRALEKLAAITNRIGYPDKWRDYSSFKVVRGDYVGNSERGSQFEFQRHMNKVGKPVNKDDWPYPPPTINASYNPLQNNITFPAGILQAPFYDNQADDAMNFGGIGAVIGHELTHGFDDQGRKFDPKGNLNDWWTAEDAREFEKRSQCIVDEYDGFTAVAEVKVKGKLTLGENTADNGGLRIAHMALLAMLAGNEPASVDGLTAQRRFFVGWANVWCQNRSDEIARLLAQTDPHSPAQFRVNGVVSNMPEFRDAFQCKADAPMVRQNACRVW